MAEAWRKDGTMEEIVRNRITMDGMREVKLVSDREIRERRMLRFVPGAALAFAKVQCYATSALSLFHGEVTFPARGMVTIYLEGKPKARRLAVWRLMPEEGYRVSEVIEFVADWYFVQTRRRAGFAFLRSLPGGVENGQVVGADLQLFQAEWALEKCVMIGG